MCTTTPSFFLSMSHRYQTGPRSQGNNWYSTVYCVAKLRRSLVCVYSMNFWFVSIQFTIGLLGYNPMTSWRVSVVSFLPILPSLDHCILGASADLHIAGLAYGTSGDKLAVLQTWKTLCAMSPPVRSLPQILQPELIALFSGFPGNAESVYYRSDYV